MLEKLQALAKKSKEQAAHFISEDATKQGLVLPFIQQVLGYNVFDVGEVIPEYTADTHLKKGEKVDYALLVNGAVQIIIECKPYNDDLSLKHAAQLFRYFTNTTARVAILTNGKTYKFYSDVDAKNKMDEEPFLTLQLDNLDNHVAREIAKLTKESFDIDSIVNAASDLKYLNKIKDIIEVQFVDPDPKFCDFLTSQVYAGQKTQKVKEQFEQIIRKALKRFLNDKLNDRLQSAITPDQEAELVASEIDDVVGDGIVTTEDELKGFMIVQAIMAEVVDLERVSARDTKSYFGVLLDDNNRKPICRLRFNTVQKYISITVNEDKEEVRQPIDRLEDIYKYSNLLRKTVTFYE
ncbi:MAG: restriction endonuclease [Hyphomicrobiales bacterium]|nr:MAG: restriction endonuclease [Hyphomicrobiales bacterium]